jgi:hypothetical protein
LKVVTSKHVGDVWSDLPNFGFSLTTVDLFFDNNYLYVRRKNLIISLVFYIVPDIYSGGFWSKFPLKNKP